MKTTVLNLIIDGIQYPLDKDKLLIGRAENCDIVIENEQISHYHCLLHVSAKDKTTIQDLNSLNGIFINGVKISDKSAFFEGDSISLGDVHISVIEGQSPVEFQQFEKATSNIASTLGEKIYIPTPNHDSDILIDGEYCNIKFEDENFSLLNDSPLSKHQLQTDYYIENDDLEDGFDILEKGHGHCVQITTSLSGSILEQFYFPVQDGTIYASGEEKKNTVLIDLLSSSKKQPFIKLKDGNIIVNKSKLFSASSNSISTDVNSNEVLILSCGTYQIFIEIAPSPGNLMHISSLTRDKAFFKDTAIKFSATILPLLLLLLVDFTIEKKQPPKQLSIIYKKPTTANVDGKKMASTNPNDKKKNTGHKSTKQPDKKIAHSKAGKKSQPKKAQPKKSQPKKMAKAKPTKAKPSKSKRKAKTKAYSFKMASNVSSVFSNTQNVKVANNSAPTKVNTNASVSGSLSTKVNGTSSNQVGNMGSDSAGRSAASYGSKGLSSKAGRDTAYIQTQTVVLGSMDPELLRKVLQQYLPQFRHCYQQELVYNSDDIKGIVDLNFEIKANGKVSKIKVRAKDSRFSKRGTNCMAKVLAIIDFPKPKGGGRVAVRQPLSFFSEQEKG